MVYAFFIIIIKYKIKNYFNNANFEMKAKI